MLKNKNVLVSTILCRILNEQNCGNTFNTYADIIPIVNGLRKYFALIATPLALKYSLNDEISEYQLKKDILEGYTLLFAVLNVFKFYFLFLDFTGSSTYRNCTRV